MPRLPLVLALGLMLAGCQEPEAPPAVSQADANAARRAFDYPAAKMVDQYDDHFDQRIFDPYRWMEDLDSPELARWVAGQNALLQDYLADVPGRELI